MITNWFVVRPGYSVVIVDEFAELRRVHFNIRQVVSSASKIELLDLDGGKFTYYSGRYRVASIKAQSCACKASK